jgi:hypothetical protein
MNFLITVVGEPGCSPIHLDHVVRVRFNEEEEVTFYK